jgi:hypothetical protein
MPLMADIRLEERLIVAVRGRAAKGSPEQRQEPLWWVMLAMEVGMVLHDLIPTLRSLTRADKLQAIQILVADLAREEGILLVSGTGYPVWSPLEATEAADTLLKMLDEHATR